MSQPVTTAVTAVGSARDDRASARPLLSGLDWWRHLVKATVVAVFVWGVYGASYSFQATLALVALVAAFAIVYSILLGYLNVFVLAQHAVIGTGAYCYAIMQPKIDSLLFATILAIAAGAVVSVIPVLPSIRISGFHLALVSIAMGTVFTGALITYKGVTGGSTGLYNFERWFDFSPLETRQSLLLATAILAVTCVVIRVSVSGRGGRLLVATGDDEFLARVVGANVAVIRVVGAAWCGALTGLLGTFWVQHHLVAAPDTYSFRLLIQVFLVLMVGGRRSVWGPIAASLIVVGVPGWVGGIDGDLLTIAFALLVLVVVVARPDGLHPEPLRDRNGLRSLLPRVPTRRPARRGPRPDTSATSSSEQAAGGSGTARRANGSGRLERIERIEVKRLTKRFGGVYALDRANLAFRTGEVVGVVGPNGSGKTTLLNCLTGVWKPDAGTIELVTPGGSHVERYPRTHRLARQGVGRSFQVPRLAAGLSVRDNLRLAGDARRSRVSERELADAIDRFGLRPWVDRSTTALSHGVRRWTELARLDLSDCSMLLLDEPAAGLTDEEIEELQHVIERWRREGRGVVLVEHNHQLVDTVADRTVVMSFGKIVAVGKLEELRLDPEVRQIIGERLT